MQRQEMQLQCLLPLVSAQTHHAQRRYIDDLHAWQLSNEWRMVGTLHLAELNEVMCRNDAHVSSLSTQTTLSSMPAISTSLACVLHVIPDLCRC
jgi:hypothetical protein